MFHKHKIKSIANSTDRKAEGKSTVQRSFKKYGRYLMIQIYIVHGSYEKAL